MTTSTNVLGEQRAIVRTFEDGAYICPWCSGPVQTASKCQNPACEAGEWATPELVARWRAEQAKREADEAERLKYFRLRYR